MSDDRAHLIEANPASDLWVYPLRKSEKLGNVEWVEFHINDFLTSSFAAHAHAEGRGDDVFRALLLWSECYRQDPAGTLPDDDVMLAQLCWLPVEAWRLARPRILQGWARCLVETDGAPIWRLGHPGLIAGIATRTYRRFHGKAVAREGAALAVRKSRIRAKLVDLKLSKMAEVDDVVTAIEAWLTSANLFLTAENVRQAADQFAAPRLVVSR